MSSLTLYRKKQYYFNGYDRLWSSWTDFNTQDTLSINSDSNALQMQVYSASLSLSSGQKMTGCQVKTNFSNQTGSGTWSGTIHAYLYTSDPTTAQSPTAVPSGYVAHVQKSVTIEDYAFTYQAFSFTGLNILSGTRVYVLFTGTPYGVTIFNFYSGADGQGQLSCSGTFASAYSLSVSPATVTAGGKVTLTVANGSGTSFSATIKYGSTTLATQSFTTGSVQITCPQSWFVTAGRTGYSSMSLSVTVTGGGQTLTGSFTLNAQALSLSVSPASVATGGSVTLTVANGVGYSLTATIKAGSTTLATQSFTTGSCTISCPKSWFTTAGNTTGKSLSLSVSVTGGPSMLTASFTLTAGSDMNPSVGTPTASVVDLTGNFPNTYIAGYSKVKVAASVSTGSNAAISTVKLSYPGGTTVTMSYNSSTGKYEATTAAPITVNTTITVTATDTRGLSGSKTVSVTGVYPYVKPSVAFDRTYTYRCDSNGDRQSGGAYYRVKATAAYADGLSGNALIKLTVKIKNTSAETAVTSGVQSGAIGSMPDPDKRYTIVVTVQDKVSAAVTKAFSLEGELHNIVVRQSADGTYLGVGKRPERASGYSDIELPRGSNLKIGSGWTFHQPGSSYSYSAMCFGYVQGDNLWLCFMPSLRGGDIVLTVTAITSANIFHVGGGRVLGSNATLTSYIQSTSQFGGGIRVKLTKSGGWGITDETPVTGVATFEYTAE